jgi:hypothetical protein
MITAPAVPRSRLGTLLCIGLLFVALIPARASAAPSQLVIETVPRLEGVRFSLDGRPFVSAANGRASITAESGAHQLRVLRYPDGRGVRLRFNRWSDIGPGDSTRHIRIRGRTTVQAGFDVSFRTKLEFVTPALTRIPQSRVTSVTVSSSRGEETFENGGSRWLEGRYVTRPTVTAIQPNRLRWTVEEVIVDGSNVVTRGDQHFVPDGKTWLVQLLLFDATFTVKDALFSFPSGKAFRLIFPDGHEELHEFGPGGRTTLRSLPRGDYAVVVRGPGIPLAAPLVISRPDQLVELTFLSYLDLATGATVLALLVVAISLLRRRRIYAEAALDDESVGDHEGQKAAATTDATDPAEQCATGEGHRDQAPATASGKRTDSAL